MIGLGTMGRNLVLNIADHGFAVCGYDRDITQQQRLITEGVGKPVTVATSLQELVNNLEKPAKIMLLVPAGKIVDAVLADLVPLLQKDDIIIDGGNSHFTDTDRRYIQLQGSGIHFMGMGVSGGEEGARFGPSMMPGSNEQSFNAVKNILQSIAAKTEDGPCVTFIGNGAAGHYTKMVHMPVPFCFALSSIISSSKLPVVSSFFKKTSAVISIKKLCNSVLFHSAKTLCSSAFDKPPAFFNTPYTSLINCMMAYSIPLCTILV